MFYKRRIEKLEFDMKMLKDQLRYEKEKRENPSKLIKPVPMIELYWGCP